MDNSDYRRINLGWFDGPLRLQRGLFGAAPVSPHFEAVDVTVRLAAAEPAERLEPLKAAVLQRCPVDNLLKDSGARVKVDWLIEGGRP